MCRRCAWVLATCLTAAACGAASPDPADTGDTVDAADTGDPVDAADTGDTSHAADTVDAADVADTVDAGDAADTVDAADVADTVDAGDVADTVDAGDAADTVDAGDAADIGDTGDAADIGDTGDAADIGDTGDAAASSDTTDTADAAVPPWDGDIPDTGPIPDELRLRRIAVGALDGHQVTTEGVSERGAGYGYGIVPFDADGDGDLDLFVGTVPNSATPACVYENVSAYERPYFRQRADWCAPVGFLAEGGTAVDHDGAGRHALIVSAGTQFYAVSLTPSWQATRLLEPTPRCSAGAIVALDVDADGVLELVSSCNVGFSEGPRVPSVVGNVWERTDDGGWRASERIASPVIANALAIGVLDVDEDGLLDLVTVVDTFGTPDRYDPTSTPGAVIRRCAPDQACTFDRRPLAEDARAWGSFMGLTTLRVGGESRLVMTDIGPFGGFAWRDGASRASELALDPAPFGNVAGSYAFSWGLVTEDWDDDGDDDLLASFGPFAAVANAETTVLSDSVLLQDASGGFAFTGRPFALESHDDHRDPVYRNPRSSRAAIRLDIDQDGRQEVVIAASNGPPFVYQHTGAVRRCTVRPVPRYVATWGSGYRERTADGGWQPIIVHGELLSSEGPWPILRRPAGEVQFPSGAVLPYDCGDRGVVDVEEPEWLRAFQSAGGVRVIIDTSVWSGPVDAVRVAWREADGAVALADAVRSDDQWFVPGIGAAREVMVAIDGQWVARWLTPTALGG